MLFGTLLTVSVGLGGELAPSILTLAAPLPLAASAAVALEGPLDAAVDLIFEAPGDGAAVLAATPLPPPLSTRATFAALLATSAAARSAFDRFRPAFPPCAPPAAPAPSPPTPADDAAPVPGTSVSFGGRSGGGQDADEDEDDDSDSSLLMPGGDVASAGLRGEGFVGVGLVILAGGGDVGCLCFLDEASDLCFLLCSCSSRFRSLCLAIACDGGNARVPTHIHTHTRTEGKGEREARSAVNKRKRQVKWKPRQPQLLHSPPPLSTARRWTKCHFQKSINRPIRCVDSGAARTRDRGREAGRWLQGGMVVAAAASQPRARARWKQIEMKIER